METRTNTEILLEKLLTRLDALEEKIEEPSKEIPLEILTQLQEEARQQEAEREAQHAEDTKPTRFYPKDLFSYDGNPEIEGVENYAPDNWDKAKWKKNNGLPANYPDPIIFGNSFLCPKNTAEAFEKLGLGKIHAD